ncbi:hypothetical protein P389DRAFT_15524 [Cystobasidium minutum MCA 4210]|uniref:uncharacterized protein n=1 Tax=Cystobasidium minutum MCA 4210 TaxID=1397322 RepID=UPI0034CEC218|eukprot:jgi/Rhomi1/15524/CE15523_398
MRTRHKTAKKSSLKQGLQKTLGALPGNKKRKPVHKPKPVEPPAGPAINYEARDALPRPAKLQEIDRQLKVTQTSTASLGKYDNKLAGENTREKGIRRHFESNEIDTKTELERYKAALESLEEDEKKVRRKAGLEDETDVVNARKAIRGASGGKGSANLAGAEMKSKNPYKNGAKGKGGGGKTRSSSSSKGK